MKKCPKCGKKMVEQTKFPGLWLCVDYLEPINFKAPFKFKCQGMRMEKTAVQALKQEINRQICEQN